MNHELTSQPGAPPVPQPPAPETSKALPIPGTSKVPPTPGTTITAPPERALGTATHQPAS